MTSTERAAASERIVDAMFEVQGVYKVTCRYRELALDAPGSGTKPGLTFWRTIHRGDPGSSSVADEIAEILIRAWGRSTRWMSEGTLQAVVTAAMVQAGSPTCTVRVASGLMTSVGQAFSATITL